MKTITQYPVQNYLVTPAAYSVNQNLPQSINDQKWHLSLSGVAIADFKCNSNNDWSGETLQLSPDIRTPIQYAINNFSIQVPANPPYTVEGDGSIAYLFNVEQYTIVSALGSIFDKNTAVNAGFSVNTWRPVPFARINGENNAPTLNRIFKGILIDVATRDIDAFLYRVSFQINILGKIVFAKSQIF
ncbi:MAG: hypothetical protein H0U27_07965 [Nitrosopumilus sp.]|nr:hypothetical protein [Nitrosopumilus sp.]